MNTGKLSLVNQNKVLFKILIMEILRTEYCHSIDIVGCFSHYPTKIHCHFLAVDFKIMGQSYDLP